MLNVRVTRLAVAEILFSIVRAARDRCSRASSTSVSLKDGLRPPASWPVSGQRMDAGATSSSAEEEPPPATALIIPAEARLRFRCRLLIQTGARWLNCILAPSLSGILGSRQAAGLALACLKQSDVASLARASRETLRCLKGAFGQH